MKRFYHKIRVNDASIFRNYPEGDEFTVKLNALIVYICDDCSQFVLTPNRHDDLCPVEPHEKTVQLLKVDGQ